MLAVKSFRELRSRTSYILKISYVVMIVIVDNIICT